MRKDIADVVRIGTAQMLYRQYGLCGSTAGDLSVGSRVYCHQPPRNAMKPDRLKGITVSADAGKIFTIARTVG